MRGGGNSPAQKRFFNRCFLRIINNIGYKQGFPSKETALEWKHDPP